MHIFAGKHYASPAVYGDLAAFFDDLAKVYQAEIAALVDGGCTYIQMDEVALAMLCDETVRTQIAQQGQDPDGLVDTYIDAINAALAKRPKTIAVGVHVCRGNFKGHYLSGGGYDRIAERFFSRTDATHFCSNTYAARVCFARFGYPRARASYLACSARRTLTSKVGPVKAPGG